MLSVMTGQQTENNAANTRLTPQKRRRLDSGGRNSHTCPSARLKCHSAS